MRSIHQSGYVHCDVKPENIVLGNQNDPNDKDTYYLIDLGLATEYLKGNQHIRKNRSTKIAGSFYFMSLNASNGVVQTRRDDLESLAYTLVYLAKKELPWMKYKRTPNVTIKELNKRVHNMKKQTNLDDLCSGLPNTLKHFLSYARNL